MFSTSKLRSMTSVMRSCQLNVLKVLDQYADSGRDLPIEKIYTLAICQVVSKCFYSIDIDVYSKESETYVKSARSFFDGASSLNWFLLANLPSWALRVFGLGFGDVDCSAYFKDVVRHALEQRDKNDLRNDLIQLLIDAREKNKESGDKGLSEIEAIANAIVVFAAGFDTSKNSMGLIVWRLAIHQDVQEKVYQEILHQLGDDLERQLTYDDYAKLTYLEAMINETLRTTSIDSRGVRVTTSDTTIPFTDIHVPKGTTIHIPFYVVHFDKNNWPEPMKFDPERFLPEHKDTIKPCTYLAFGAGPRECVGRRFAMLDLKACVVDIVRNYKVLRSASTKDYYQYKMRIFMTCPYDCVVKLERRRNGRAR